MENVVVCAYRRAHSQILFVKALQVVNRLQQRKPPFHNNYESAVLNQQFMQNTGQINTQIQNTKQQYVCTEDGKSRFRYNRSRKMITKGSEAWYIQYSMYPGSYSI